MSGHRFRNCIQERRRLLGGDFLKEKRAMATKRSAKRKLKKGQKLEQTKPLTTFQATHKLNQTFLKLK
jgi:hypothetical protein